MLKFLKRLAGMESKPSTPPPKRVSGKRRAARPYSLSGPAPLPTVVEGNDQSDWALWQDSVDSQMQGLSQSPQDSRYADTSPSELGDIDPFASVPIKKPRR